MLTQAHKHTRGHALTSTQAHKHPPARACMPPPPCAHALTHMHAHTCRHTHTFTHTHTRTRAHAQEQLQLSSKPDFGVVGNEEREAEWAHTRAHATLKRRQTFHASNLFEYEPGHNRCVCACVCVRVYVRVCATRWRFKYLSCTSERCVCMYAL